MRSKKKCYDMQTDGGCHHYESCKTEVTAIVLRENLTPTSLNSQVSNCFSGVKWQEIYPSTFHTSYRFECDYSDKDHYPRRKTKLKHISSKLS
jgi:hypothetical protein